MCNSATYATYATSGTNLRMTVTNPKIVQMHIRLKSRLILAYRFRICIQNLRINNMCILRDLVDFRWLAVLGLILTCVFCFMVIVNPVSPVCYVQLGMDEKA